MARHGLQTQLDIVRPIPSALKGYWSSFEVRAMLSRPLMTVHETAAQLKVKESTIRGWIRTGRLRAIKFGREWRIAVVDLERFLNQHANVTVE